MQTLIVWQTFDGEILFYFIPAGMVEKHFNENDLLDLNLSYVGDDLAEPVQDNLNKLSDLLGFLESGKVGEWSCFRIPPAQYRTLAHHFTGNLVITGFFE